MPAFHRHRVRERKRESEGEKIRERRGRRNRKESGKEERMNGRGKAGQRELMPAPQGLRKQWRDTVVDVECGVRQMLTLMS